MAFLAAASIVFLATVVVYALLIGTYKGPSRQIMGHNLLGEPIFAPPRSRLFEGRAPYWAAPEQYGPRDTEGPPAIVLGLVSGALFWLFQYWESSWLRYGALLLSAVFIWTAFSTLFMWWMVKYRGHDKSPNAGRFFPSLGLFVLVAAAVAGVFFGWDSLLAEFGFSNPAAPPEARLD